MKRIILSLVAVVLMSVFICSCGENIATRYDVNMKGFVELPEITLGDVEKSNDFKEYFSEYLINAVENDGILTHLYDATVKKGDNVTITVKESGLEEACTLIAGDKEFKYGNLSKEIIGKKAGEEFNYIFKSQSGTETEFEVKIEYVSVAELNSSSAGAMGYKDEKEAEEALREKAVFDYVADWLAKNSEIKDYPETEYKELYDAQYNYYRQLASGYGLSVDEYCEREKLSKKDFEKKLEKRVKEIMNFEMPIYAFAKQNKIKITEQDIQNKAKQIAKEKGGEAQAVLEQTPRRDIEFMVIKDFVVDFIMTEGK